MPHPISPASSRRWKYRKEIETIGRVVAVIHPIPAQPMTVHLNFYEGKLPESAAGS